VRLEHARLAEKLRTTQRWLSALRETSAEEAQQHQAILHQYEIFVKQQMAEVRDRVAFFFF
jgi:hypothetical protein